MIWTKGKRGREFSHVNFGERNGGVSETIFIQRDLSSQIPPTFKREERQKHEDMAMRERGRD